MTRRLHLDPPRRVGDWTVAVLCERRLVVQGLGVAVLAGGHKIPLALVMQRGGQITATDLTGRPLDPATLDEACPGLLQAMAADAPPIPP
jgi:hypothetical protein